MENLAVRVVTFNQRWVGSQVHATSRQIAEAGFFFLGLCDHVKCWYCNIGVAIWEFTDDPWVEHSKWGPTCEFLLQKKGPAFIRLAVALHPHPSH